MAVIRAKNLKKVYKYYKREILALKGIDLEITQGEFVTIMGPSGAGKTTTLNLIGLLDSPTYGELRILNFQIENKKEKEIQKLRKENIGYVFQDFLLIESLTSFENVALAQYFCKGRVDKEKVKKILELVGMEHRMNHYPNELSGGEMQRVAIARALVNSPRIILADEPTGNLDTKTSMKIFNLFKDISQKEFITIIVATHNIKLGYMADRIIHLVDGEIKLDERK